MMVVGGISNVIQLVGRSSCGLCLQAGHNTGSLFSPVCKSCKPSGRKSHCSACSLLHHWKNPSVKTATVSHDVMASNAMQRHRPVPNSRLDPCHSLDPFCPHQTMQLGKSKVKRPQFCFSHPFACQSWPHSERIDL